MKINKNLEKLNVDFPAWAVVDEYLQLSDYRNLLLDFLSEAFSSYVSFRDHEKLLGHAFRILSYLGEKNVIPYIVECMRLYRPLEASLYEQEKETHKFDSESYNDLNEKVLAFLPRNRISENLLLSCKHSLDLFSMDPKMLETFWVLYETTLDKEIGLEFLGSAIQANLSLIGKDLEKRKLTKVKSKLITALKDNFFFDPFFSSYHALMTLDVNFIPYLEQVIRDGLEENYLELLQQSEAEDVDELFILLGQIPVSWFVLKELKANRYQEISEHVALFLNEDPGQDFLDFYMKGIPFGQRDFGHQISLKKDCEFRTNLKAAFLKTFGQTSKKSQKKKALGRAQLNNEPEINNVIPLFQH